MAANKRKISEIVRDRAIIARLFVEGHAQAEIVQILKAETGADYTLSQPQISRDIKAIELSWTQNDTCAISAEAARALQALHAKEGELWELWHRGREDQTSTHFAEQVMREILGCLTARCRLLGITGSTRQNIGSG